MTQLLEVGQKFLADWKCIGGKEPLFFGKKALFWESRANCSQSVVLDLQVRHEANVQRPTPNVQHRMQTSELSIERWRSEERRVGKECRRAGGAVVGKEPR